MSLEGDIIRIMAKMAFLLKEEVLIFWLLLEELKLHIKNIPLISYGLKYLTDFQRRII